MKREKSEIEPDSVPFYTVEEMGKWSKSIPRGTLLDAGYDPDFVPT